MKTRPVSNPPNPWAGGHAEYLEVPPAAELKVFLERAGSILSENNSPDLGFRFSLNPYRGCYHGCAYCYARPTHAYLDFGAGTDFDRKIIVKINAPTKLREAFQKPSWQGEMVVFSGNTDCYQPLEASYRLTRRCLEVCHEFRNPVGLITKAALIRRDIDLLQQLHRDARLHVTVSVAFTDEEMARKLEPWVPSPAARFRTMRALADAGIPVGVAVAPIIPGMNDSQVADVLTQAHDHGARWAFRTLLRLPQETRVVFSERLKEEYPDRFDKVMNGVRAARKGAINQSRFGERMQGSGQRWQAVDWLFETTCRKLGLRSGMSQEVGLSSEALMTDDSGTGGPGVGGLGVRDADGTVRHDGQAKPAGTTFIRPGSQFSLFTD